jgi:predicted RNA-binding protein
LVLVTAPSGKPYTGTDEHRRLCEHLERELGPYAVRLHVCYYSAPHGVTPQALCETYPLSQFEIAEPLDHETLRATAESVASYVEESGHESVVIHRGKGTLDDEVEAAVMDTCDAAHIPLTTVWCGDAWGGDAFSALIQALRGCMKGDVKDG